ncbi:MAG: carboxypeptidase-like regulatory domain-containing protein [Bacteroidota bacterium]
MKKYILIAIMIVTGSTLIAGNIGKSKEKNETKLISGKVIDKVSGEEIAGAEVKIGDKIFHTDLNGNFSANIQTSKTEALVKYISYNDSKVNIAPFSYNTIVVELEAK